MQKYVPFEGDKLWSDQRERLPNRNELLQTTLNIYKAVRDHTPDTANLSIRSFSRRPDISRVELVADARRGVRSHSHPMASATQRSRCGQIGSPEGWRPPNLPQPAAGTNCHRPKTTQTQPKHLNYFLISFPCGDLHEIFGLDRVGEGYSANPISFAGLSENLVSSFQQTPPRSRPGPKPWRWSPRA